MVYVEGKGPNSRKVYRCKYIVCLHKHAYTGVLFPSRPPLGFFLSSTSGKRLSRTNPTALHDLKCDDPIFTHVDMHVCVHRAPGHFFQPAAGRVNGEALKIGGGSYHRKVIKPAKFTWIRTINQCTRVAYAITLSCSLTFPFLSAVWHTPLRNTVWRRIVSFLKQQLSFIFFLSSVGVTSTVMEPQS